MRDAGRGLLLLVTAVSLYLLLPSLVSVFSSWRSLAHLNWYWAGLALLAEIASYVSLWRLDRVALRITSWFPVVCAQLSGNAVGRIVPGGGATAGAFSVGMLRRAGLEVGRAAAALAASTALQIGTTLALPLLALPAIDRRSSSQPQPRHSRLPRHRRAAAAARSRKPRVRGRPAARSPGPRDPVGREPDRPPPPKTTGLPERLLAERNFIRTTIGERWAAAVLSAAGNTGFDYLALLCALRAIGAEPRPSLVLLAYTAAALLALVPLTPGGLGFVEAGLVGTLTVAGVSPGDALVATLFYRLVAFWLPIPLGGVAYVLFRHRYQQ